MELFFDSENEILFGEQPSVKIEIDDTIADLKESIYDKYGISTGRLTINGFGGRKFRDGEFVVDCISENNRANLLVLELPVERTRFEKLW